MRTKHANTDARLALACALMAAALAGCSKEVPPPAPAPAPTASAPATAPASAPAGPIIAPATISEPTDAQRSTGATIAAQGGNGVPACNSCHGAKGEGNAASGFPRIAGQSHTYLLHELQSFANGTHKSDTMTPIATALSADERIAVAAYFASLAPDGSGAADAAAGAASGAASNPAVAGGTGTVTTAASKGSAAARKALAPNGRGATLATVGDNAKGVQACANCHGPGGTGSGGVYPYLAGQYAAYLANTLGDWRSGTRTDDPSGQMPLIAKALDAKDIAALAAYYGAQPPRATAIDAEHMAAIGPLAPASAAVTSGPRQASPGEGASPAAGTGSEQGAPTTGGGQGAGGGGGTGSAATGAPQGASADAATAASGSTPPASSR